MQEVFFEFTYKVKFQNLFSDEFHYLKQLHLILSQMFFCRGNLSLLSTLHIVLYYVDVPNLALGNPKMLASLSNKAVESVWKEHMTSFHKRLPIYDLALGLEFFQQV